MVKVKVFSTGRSAGEACKYLNETIEAWQTETNADIIKAKPTSNKYGWMIVVTYTTKIEVDPNKVIVINEKEKS